MRREADFPGEPTTIGELMRTPQTTPTRDEAVPAEDSLVLVRRDMLASACAAIRLKKDAPKTVEYLRSVMFAPAPASGGVDAVLNLYREAVRIDVKMEGPQFMGANSSALRRAWEADRASLSPAATPVSEAGGEPDWNGIAAAIRAQGE